MPNIRDIQEFADELKRLGNEPEILKKRGETEEPEAAPPEFPGGESPMSGSPQEELEEGIPPDIDQLLASLGDEPLSGEEPPGLTGGEPEGGISPEGEPGVGETAGGPPEDLFIDDFLRESDQAEESELTSISEPEDSLFFQVPSPEDLTPPEGLESVEAPSPGGPEPFEVPEEAGPFGEMETSEALGSPEAPEAFEAPEEAPPFEEPEPWEAAAPLGESEEVPAGPGPGSQAESEPFEETPVPEGFELPEEVQVPLEEGAQGSPSSPEAFESGEAFELPEDLELPEDFAFDQEAGPEQPEGPFSEEKVPGESGGAGEPGEEFSLPGFEEELFASEQPPGEEAGAESEGLDEFADFGALDMGGEPVGAGVPPFSDLDEESAQFEAPQELGAIGEGSEQQGGSGAAPEPAIPEVEIPSEEALFEEQEFATPAETSGVPEGAGTGAVPGAEGEPAPERPTPDLSAAREGIENLGVDDIGERFALGGEEAPPSEEELNPALAVGESASEPPGAPEGAPGPQTGEPVSLRLSNRDFEKVQRTLSTLPRNLRIIIEELIGEQDLGGPQLEQLVGLLVQGAPPQEIAQATSRIVGRRIEIPAAYAKRTGLAFEEERATLTYRFRHNILPILRVFVLAAAVLALLVFLGYRFVYRPIHAYSVYATGYSQLQQDNFITANEDFDRASRQWQMKNWYYRYAEGYVGKRQYSFAAQKYETLLKVWPGDRKGIFDYAAMESKLLGNYGKANQLLDLILGKDMWDYQGLLRAGDNYLAWGSEQPSKYELARRDYAMLLQHYGTSNEVLFRMLRYFILTDNLKQVEILKDRFQADPRIKVDPVAYAQLGGYLIDKNRIGDVHSILFRALKVDPTLPETNYNLARYFKKIGNYGQEAVALQRSLDYLQGAAPLTRKRLGMLIDTYGLIGENLYREKRYLDAQAAYTKGINRYEAALRQDQLKPAPEYGRLYADLGDVNYYASGNYDEALRLYLKAEENGYATPELRYKEGYVYYRNQDYRNALLKFYNAAGRFSDNRDLIYATANSLYKRNDYFAAEGYYLNLLNTLEEQRRSIADFQPNVIPEQHDLLVDLMKVYNNLGVTLNQLSKRSSDPTKYSESLVNLTHSMEAYNQLTRNPVTKETPPSINLAFINTKNILYPTPNYELQIYSDIPQNMNGKSF